MNQRWLMGILASMVLTVCGAESDWEAFAPPPDSEFDWIQLDSGEWLKGDLKAMYNYSLEFESDELDTLNFDFDDIRRLRTRNTQTILIESGDRQASVLRGRIDLREDQLLLIQEGQTQEIGRGSVVSIAQSAVRERDLWSGMFSVGANARGGNTRTTDVTVRANLKRRTAATRFNMDYLANYSETRQERTADNQRLNGFVDRFLTSRLYWQVLSGEYYRDRISNIEAQYSAATGVGFDFVRSSRAEWTASIGVGYQEKRFESVEAGEDATVQSPFFTAGTRLDYEVSGNVDYVYEYDLRVLNERNGTYTHHMLTSLSFDLVHDFDLDVSLIWDRVENPQANEDGSVPAQDDYQVVVSLAYDF